EDRRVRRARPARPDPVRVGRRGRGAGRRGSGDPEEPPRRGGRAGQPPQSPSGPEAGAMSDEALPDFAGHFGRYGGRFVPEALVKALDELDAAYRDAKTDPAVQARFTDLLEH